MYKTNNYRSFNGLCCIPAAVLYYLVVSNAVAQQVAENGGTDSTPQTTDRGLVIEEVIVTTSKREESLQEVLGSVSAFDGDLLQRENVQDFQALAELVPGMVAQTEDRVAIRGIARPRSGGPSPVAFHVNDLFLAERGEPYYDLQAVEVLKGPSGTLFGRNATAGSINAKWRRPDADWGFGLNARYSSLTEEQLQLYANIPFLGKDDRRLLGRFAAMKRRKDGTVDNLLVPDDEDVGNKDDWFFRLYLTSEPTDNLQLALRAVRYETNPRGAPSVYSPDEAARRSGDYEEVAAQRPSDDITEVRSRIHEIWDESWSETTRVDGEVTWSLTELPWMGSVDLMLLGGEQRRKSQGTGDLDGTEEPLLDVFTMGVNIRRTAELRFVSQNDSGIAWLAGLFWYRQISDSDTFVKARALVRPSLFFGTPAFPGEPSILIDADVERSDQRILDHSEAVFLNLDFDLAKLFGWPNIEVTTGIRRNWDKFRDVLGRYAFTATTVDPQIPLDAPIQDDRHIDQFAEFVETTGELAARWFYSDTGMAYVRLARGYKPGLAQLIQEPNGNLIQNPVDAEFLDSLEVGWKVAFFQRSLTLNTAAFYYDYSGLQVSQIAPGGFITENAAAATVYGAEADIQWMPSEALRLQATAAWTDASYDEYCGNDPAFGGAFAQGDVEGPGVDPDCDEENPQDFSGQTMPAAPEYSLSLVASYTFSLGDFGTLTPSIRSSWTDELDRRGFGNPIDTVDAYSSTHARLSWLSASGRFKVEGFVENLEDNTDTFFAATAPALNGGTPQTTAVISNLPPRIYGVVVEANF